MNFSDISKKTKIAPELAAYKATILQKMEIAYTGSKTAREMFDKWVKDGETIDIQFAKFDIEKPASALTGTGIVKIDPLSLNGYSYINYTGKAIPYTLLGALTHEFGHALASKSDPKFTNPSLLKDYKGTNVPFINKIWSQIKTSTIFKTSGEVGLDLMISYSGVSDEIRQRVGYNYTNKTPINEAVNVDFLNRKQPIGSVSTWNSSNLGISNDLLIGSYDQNIKNSFQSGAGNDFLFGGGGDDVLDGGNGTDTAVYFGKKTDYDIKQNYYFKLDGFNNPWKWDGTWTVRHDRNKEDNDAGTDILKNIEFIQFDDGKSKPPGLAALSSESALALAIDESDNKETYSLKTAGLAFQSDFAVVIDTTGSMGSSINSVKNQASALIDALFANAPDSRIAIVGFKDTLSGEPSKVILPFTEQNEFADRKSAAIAALNSITVGGGGDIPETAFDGLKTALDGLSIGKWRAGAGTLRIALFTDAPVKDEVLSSQVTALAQSIGGGIGISSKSSLAFTGGKVDTFALAPVASTTSTATTSGLEGLVGDSEADPLPFTPSDDPIDFDPTPAQVQIFTIFTGPSNTNTKALSDIASANGGAFFKAPTNNELVNTLIKIINAPPVAKTPSIYITTNSDAGETTADEAAIPGQFILNRIGDLTEALTVAYTLSGTATAGVDYQTLPGTVTFEAGKDNATIDLNIIDDDIYEGTESVTLTIAENPKYILDYGDSETIDIVDNEYPKSQLIQSTPSSISIEGGNGSSLLKFTKLANAGDNKNELAAFVVDDDLGSIDGVLPGDANYLAAAIARSQTIFSSLGDNALDRQFDLDSQRYLSFNSGDRIQFLLVIDDTLDRVRANLDNGQQPSNVIFSSPTANPNSSARSQFTALPNNRGYQIA